MNWVLTYKVAQVYSAHELNTSVYIMLDKCDSGTNG